MGNNNNKISSTSDFVRWVKEGIHYDTLNLSYLTPVSAENLIRNFLSRELPDFDVPGPHKYGRYQGVTKYLEDIWMSNQHKNYKTTNFLWGGILSAIRQESDMSYQSNSTFTKDKSGVERGYDLILSSLRDAISAFESLNPKNQDLDKVKLEITRKLRESLANIRKEKDYVFQCMSWDKLVIGFFGETNAGKSTVIESLRILLNETKRTTNRKRYGNVDGEIVGDGRQDFTQDYNEYTMTMENQQFTLIDVPGIEGNENLYKGKIGEALRKAHIIFFVNGHNKDIDKGTAEKIRQYMSDGVKVIVIQNVRGNAGSYEYPEDRRCLITTGVRTVMNGLDAKFKSILGNKYSQIVAVQGLLSMCAYADISPKREDLVKKQKILFSYFGEDCGKNISRTRENIRKFSNIDSVINIIRERADNFKAEIADANFIKLQQFCTISLKEFIDIVDRDRTKFQSYKDRVAQFQRQNLNHSRVYSSLFEREATQEVEAILNKFAKDAYALIERCNFNQIDVEYKAVKRRVEEAVKSFGETYSNKFAASINTRARELSNIPGFSILDNTFLSDTFIDIRFDVGKIRNEDDISFGDFCTSVGSAVGGATTGAVVGGVLGSVIPVIGNVVGAWIGGIIGGGSGLVGGNIKAGEEQTRRAKKKASEMIENLRSQYRSLIKTKAGEFSRSAQNNVISVNSQADNRIQEINTFYSCVAETASKLRNTLAKVNEYGK